MEIEVRRYGAGGRPVAQQVELPAGSRIVDLLARLELSEDDVGFLLVNRGDGSFERILHDGDRVTIIPPIAGG